MSKVMITIHSEEGMPALEDVKSRLGLDPSEVDDEFGVQLIDQDAHDYAILVDEDAARRILSSEGSDASGPYANVRIAAFGPPER
ncbi:MAG TPA: hypothetical protein VLS93_01735 [Anaeromyxobacteraceae bacterium]|nr:hypothetical protein [Anaeromyxobacteraceae bacterium]